MQRLAVLFSRLSGYMARCLQTLTERHGVRLLVIRVPPSEQAPFDDRYFDWIEALYDRAELDRADMERLLRRFDPDAIYLAGWFDRTYLQVARTMRREGVPVVSGCDRQWDGSLRKQVARLLAPWVLHPSIDVLWVPGERQRQYARRLGFAGARCWSGVYACDWSAFAVRDEEQTEEEQTEEEPEEEQTREAASAESPSPAFLFVGRYIEVKELRTLVAAYQQYRRMTDTPWPLHCVGTGPLQSLLQNTPGIVDKGFVQPDAMPAIMREAGAFVLPSRHEPWGVVVQEAAAARCPLICSEDCGAAVHLLQDGYNGFLFDTGDVDHLAHCLLQMSTLKADERRAMGTRSFSLSKQFTPERWSDTLAEGVARLNTAGAPE